MMSEFFKKLRNVPQVVDSHLDTSYRVGMRVIKSVAAVMVCMLIALLTGSRSAIPITAVSAMVTIRATRGETVYSGLFRVLGTIIGGILGMAAVVIGLFLPYYNEGLFVVIIPLMLMLNLYLCNVLKMQDSCSISCVVTILVGSPITQGATVDDALIYTLFRVQDTLIGVVVATVMNIVPYHIAEFYRKKKSERQ